MEIRMFIIDYNLLGRVRSSKFFLLRSYLMCKQFFIKTHIGLVLSYSVSILTWNQPQQHAATAAAASELPGNELVTTQTIAVACY
jgi:hypothetical protein